MLWIQKSEIVFNLVSEKIYAARLFHLSHKQKGCFISTQYKQLNEKKRDQKPRRHSMEEAEKRFQMKASSSAAEGIFIASRKRLHRPTKVSS